MNINENSSANDIWDSFKYRIKKASSKLKHLSLSKDTISKSSSRSDDSNFFNNGSNIQPKLAAKWEYINSRNEADLQNSIKDLELARNSKANSLSGISAIMPHKQIDSTSNNSSLLRNTSSSSCKVEPGEPRLLGPTFSELQQMPSVVLTAFMLDKRDHRVAENAASPDVLVRLYVSPVKSMVIRFSTNSSIKAVKDIIFSKAMLDYKDYKACAVFEDLEEGSLVLDDELNLKLWCELPSVAQVRMVHSTGSSKDAFSEEKTSPPESSKASIPSITKSLSHVQHSHDLSSLAEIIAGLSATPSLNGAVTVIDPNLMATPRKVLNVVEECLDEKNKTEIADNDCKYKARSSEWGDVCILDYTAKFQSQAVNEIADASVTLHILLPSGNSFEQSCQSNDTLEFLLLVLSKKCGFDYDAYTLNASGVSIDPRIEIDKTVREFLVLYKVNFLKLVQAEKLYSNYAVYLVNEKGITMEKFGSKVALCLELVVQQRQGKFVAMAASFEAIVQSLLGITKYASFTGKKQADDFVIEKIAIDKLSLTVPFLMTFRVLFTPLDLFQTLTQRALSTDSTAAKLALIEVLKIWVENHWIDFIRNQDLYSLLFQTISDLSKHTESVVKLDLGALRQFVSLQQSVSPSSSNSKFQKKGKAIESILEQVSASVIADQLFLHHYELFKSVDPTEYLYYIWFGTSQNSARQTHRTSSYSSVELGAECELELPKHHAETSNLDRCISRFDLESNWAATEIVSVTDLRRRTKVLKKMISIASGCLDRSNFFSAFAILGGLSMNCVQRLKKTWDSVDSSTRDALAGLEQLSNPSKNMRHYRLALCRAKLPCIPLLPVDLKDLTFMHEIPTFIHIHSQLDSEKKLVNMDKLMTMFKRIHQIQEYFSTPIEGISKDHAVFTYIDKPVAVTNRQDLMAMSALCEP